MKRIVEPELLDTDAGTPEEVAASLGDLRAINRLFGGTRTMERLVRQVAVNGGARGKSSPAISLLDIATGSGDIPTAVQQRLAAEDVQLTVVGLDRAATHLNAHSENQGSAQLGSPTQDSARFSRVAGNALELPFRDAAVELVGCSLFLHHLEPDEIVRMVNESLRVCRRAVLLNDLRRNWLHLGLVCLAMPFYGSRLTRHDARASVRRAYTMREMRDILGRTNAARVEIVPYYLQRMGAIAWKR